MPKSPTRAPFPPCTSPYTNFKATVKLPTDPSISPAIFSLKTAPPSSVCLMNPLSVKSRHHHGVWLVDATWSYLTFTIKDDPTDSRMFVRPFEIAQPRIHPHCPRRSCYPPRQKCVSKDGKPISLHSDGRAFDVYAMSDLHADHEENLEWLQSLSTRHFSRDILIVAGDISHDLFVLRSALRLLTKRFKRVAFVPGNHELWVAGAFGRGCRKGTDSMGKLEAVMEMCEEMGVITRPTKIDHLWIVPLLSWHHKSFDCEADLPTLKDDYVKGVSDYKFCKWTRLPIEETEWGNAALAQRFDELNSEITPLDDCDVISFSHFVPRHDLIPEKHHLRVPFLAKVAGSKYLNERIRKLRPHIHVFGHTHIAWDATLDGVRYIQCPLGTPKERRGRPSSLILSNSEYNPRIYKRHWSIQWKTEHQWHPAKIYTHDPSAVSSLSVPSTPKRPEGSDPLIATLTTPLTRPKLMKNEGRPVNAGIMHPLYARWSQYYSCRER